MDPFSNSALNPNRDSNNTPSAQQQQGFSCDDVRRAAALALPPRVPVLVRRVCKRPVGGGGAGGHHRAGPRPSNRPANSAVRRHPVLTTARDGRRRPPRSEAYRRANGSSSGAGSRTCRRGTRSHAPSARRRSSRASSAPAGRSSSSYGRAAYRSSSGWSRTITSSPPPAARRPTSTRTTRAARGASGRSYRAASPSRQRAAATFGRKAARPEQRPRGRRSLCVLGTRRARRAPPWQVLPARAARARRERPKRTRHRAVISQPYSFSLVPPLALCFYSRLFFLSPFFTLHPPLSAGEKADVDYCDTYSFLHLGVRELTEQRAFNAPTNQMNADQIIQRAELPLHGVPGCGHMNQCPGGHRRLDSSRRAGRLAGRTARPGHPRMRTACCRWRLGAAAALGGAAGALAGGGALGGPNSLAQAAGLGGAAGMMGLSGSLAPGGMGPCGGLGQCGVPPCVTSAALAAADALWPPSSPAHHQHSQIGGALGGPNPLGGANSLPMGGPMGGAATCCRVDRCRVGRRTRIL